MIDNATNLSAEHLEDLLNDAEIYLDEDILSEECKCESSHKTSPLPCSEKVTSIVTHSCQPPKLICFNATVSNLEHMEQGYYCICSIPASECWSIRPV